MLHIKFEYMLLTDTTILWIRPWKRSLHSESLHRRIGRNRKYLALAMSLWAILAVDELWWFFLKP